MQWQVLWSILALLATALCAEAGNTPQGAVAELALRLNSRFVAELVGEVDFDFTYFGKGIHAYALEEAVDVQRKADVKLLADGKTRVLRQSARDDTSEGVLLTLGPDKVTRKILKAKAQGRKKNPRSTVNDSAAVVAQNQSRPPVEKHYAYTRPFFADSTRTFGGKAPRLRFRGDRRGDVASFDLSQVDVPGMLRREKPQKRLPDVAVQLGVKVSRPSKRDLAPITKIAEEHPLADRRVMRLDLRQFYAALPPGVHVDIEVAALEHKGRRARAEVRWHFSDRPEQQAAATLALQQTPQGWRILRAWDFIEQLASSR